MDSKFNPSERYGTIDGGGSRLYVRFGEGKNDVAPMKRLEFLSCEWLGENRFSGIKQFAGEYAHLAVPQTERSLAQIYSAQQLVELYDRLDERGVSLFYLPEKQFKKVCWSVDPEYAAEKKKDDETDTLIWYEWLKDGHADNLQPAVRDLSAHARKGEDYRQLVRIMNSTLNTMRHGKYDPRAMYTESEFFPDGVDHAVQFICDWCPKFNSDRKDASAERAKCVQELLRTIGEKSPKGWADPSHSRNGEYRVLVDKPLYPMSAAVAALINPRTGEIHRKSNGKFRSVDEIMRAFGTSPNHGKMGVARSNLYHHLAKHRTIAACKKLDSGAIKKPSGRPFGKDLLTDEQIGAHRQSMRDVKKATRLCVRFVQKCLQGEQVSDKLF